VSYTYDSTTGKDSTTNEIVTVTVSDPLSPEEVGRGDARVTVLRRLTTESRTPARRSCSRSSLVFHQHVLDTTVPGNPAIVQSGVRVVDLEDPSDPKVTFVDLLQASAARPDRRAARSSPAVDTPEPPPKRRPCSFTSIGST